MTPHLPDISRLCSAQKRAHLLPFVACPLPSVLSMRFFLTPLLFVLLTAGLSAQATLVRAAPTDSFDLACTTCSMVVTDMALVRGHQVLPFNLRKSPPANLLHWRYFDKFLNRMTTYPRPLYGEECTQLIDDLKSTDTVSLHINLAWTVDTVSAPRRLFLLIGGVQKRDLQALPLECAYSDEVKSNLRFAAIAQLPKADRPSAMDTYEIKDGTISIESFDLKEEKIKGRFDFAADKAGVVKTGVFSNGRFSKE